VLFPPAKRSSASSRVVITGAGIVTALGNGWKANAEGFKTGRTAFRPLSLFDTSRQRVRQAAEVQLEESLPATHLKAREERRMDRAARLLLLAAHEAWSSANWNSREAALVLGTTSGGMSLGESYFRQATRRADCRRGQATRAAHYQPQTQALQIQSALGFSGPITIIANACASGANAIGHAYDLVRSGAAQCALTGGYDGLCQLVFAGFDSLQALSPTTCRPFDVHRDGLALGEGAAVLALETFEHAMQRGATILAEICGYGAATDCHHLTQPHPKGDAALQSMRIACAQANISPRQVGYINAHGTGTPLNDSAEASAINRWAGNDAAEMRVSSTKASIGHLLGAAGAVEAVLCAMALREQWLPPTTTTETPDPLCEFQLVREPTQVNFDYALSNSFGFGGANATLVLRRWQ
jgi:3-oxoacyl-[acyl-carrier-protein] synthase II